MGARDGPDWRHKAKSISKIAWLAPTAVRSLLVHGVVMRLWDKGRRSLSIGEMNVLLKRWWNLKWREGELTTAEPCGDKSNTDWASSLDHNKRMLWGCIIGLVWCKGRQLPRHYWRDGELLKGGGRVDNNRARNGQARGGGGGLLMAVVKKWWLIRDYGGGVLRKNLLVVTFVKLGQRLPGTGFVLDSGWKGRDSLQLVIALTTLLTSTSKEEWCDPAATSYCLSIVVGGTEVGLVFCAEGQTKNSCFWLDQILLTIFYG